MAGVVAWALSGGAADWPRWRGPQFNGISPESDWRTQWPAGGPPVLWKAQVGIGYASLSVSQGRLYTMGNTEETDSIYCLDAATGRELWRHSYACSSKDPNGYPGPRCTPTVDGERVYAVSRQGHFFCLESATGKVIWSKDFPRDYGAKVPTWGFAGSPLIEGEAVIVEVGGAGTSVMAFDKRTGRELWRAGEDAIGYSSIVPFDHRGERSLAIFNAAGLVGRRAADGRELWRYPWKTSWDVNAATPLVADGKVFISSGYNKGCALLDLSGAEPRVVWEHRRMRNHVATCVLWQGHLYGFDENQLKCLDWTTGEEKWADRRYGKGSLVLAGSHLIVYSDRGRVAVVKPSPDELIEIASHQVLEGKDTWAVPVLANGRLYCRSMQDLVCLDLRAR